MDRAHEPERQAFDRRSKNVRKRLLLTPSSGYERTGHRGREGSIHLRGNSSRRLRLLATGALVALTMTASAAHRPPIYRTRWRLGSHPTKKIDYEAGKLRGDAGRRRQHDAESRCAARSPTRAESTSRASSRSSTAATASASARRRRRQTESATTSSTRTARRSRPTSAPTAGYDYMAKNLASHGYTVMSLEANTTNFDNGFRDGGANARSQIIQANLELLYRWNNGAGPYVPGRARPHGRHEAHRQARLRRRHRPDGPLARRRRGHRLHRLHAQPASPPRLPEIRARRRARARAGQLHGEQDAVRHQLRRAAAGLRRRRLRRCRARASTRTRSTRRSDAARDTFAKVQWYVQGTDHNFFNTVWTSDDFSTHRPTRPARAAAAPPRRA